MKFKKPYEKAKNVILKLNENDYISYNKNPLMSKSEETALYYKWLWYILEWDLRKEIEKCKSLQEILNIFKNSNLPKSSWSSYIEDLTNYFN